DDLESVARELAQTKLDLQMARLDRGGADESRAQAEELRDEVRRLKVDRQRLEDSLSQIQQEKKSSLQRLESELAELKLKGLRELKDQRHEDEQKLALWKSQITEQLTKKVRRLNEQKSKSWITRPLSKDMIFEWETDLGLIFRQAILNETAPAREETGTGITKVTGVTQATAVTQGVAKSKRKKANVDLHRWALVGTALLVFAALVTILSSYLNIGHRQIASQPPAPAATPAPQTQSPALNAPPARKTRGSQR
ncbi:MAG TPA: hypothetical protein PKC28_16355, partial [Bdellovibrionales bacterium]|nr:hypothetical protein [Bdellovibrionales bacterium]